MNLDPDKLKRKEREKITFTVKNLILIHISNSENCSYIHVEMCVLAYVCAQLSRYGIHTVSLLDQINYQMPKLDHKVTPLI